LILEPFGVGGGPDLLARALAEKLTEILHQSVDVHNVVGEGATAAPSTAAKLPADGYTLLINTNAQAYSRAARTDLNYDPIADFVPVRTLTEQPYVLVTGKGTGIHSLSNLIAKAKNQPQIVTFGSTGVGTGTHIGGEMLNRQAGLHARHVLPGPTEAISDVLFDVALGKFTYCFAPITLALPAIRAGDLVPLGTSTRNRSRLLPNVPQSPRPEYLDSISHFGMGFGYDQARPVIASPSWIAPSPLPCPSPQCTSGYKRTGPNPCTFRKLSSAS